MFSVISNPQIRGKYVIFSIKDDRTARVHVAKLMNIGSITTEMAPDGLGGFAREWAEQNQDTLRPLLELARAPRRYTVFNLVRRGEQPNLTVYGPGGECECFDTLEEAHYYANAEQSIGDPVEIRDDIGNVFEHPQRHQAAQP